MGTAHREETSRMEAESPECRFKRQEFLPKDARIRKHVHFLALAEQWGPGYFKPGFLRRYIMEAKILQQVAIAAGSYHGIRHPTLPTPPLSYFLSLPALLLTIINQFHGV